MKTEQLYLLTSAAQQIQVGGHQDYNIVRRAAINLLRVFEENKGSKHGVHAVTPVTDTDPTPSSSQVLIAETADEPMGDHDDGYLEEELNLDTFVVMMIGTDGNGYIEDDIAKDFWETYATTQDSKDRLKSFKGGGKGKGGYRNAKQQMATSKVMRGTDTDKEARRSRQLAKVKAKSQCSKCLQKGHWHADEVCPLNGGTGQMHKELTCNVNSCCCYVTKELHEGLHLKTPALRKAVSSPHVTRLHNVYIVESAITHVYVSDSMVSPVAILDTACGKTVCGGAGLRLSAMSCRHMPYQLPRDYRLETVSNSGAAVPTGAFTRHGFQLTHTERTGHSRLPLSQLRYLCWCPRVHKLN